MKARVATGLFMAALASAAPAAHAGDVTGTFSVTGGGRIAPMHAAAFETRDPRNPREKVIEVVLSGAPVDVVQAAAALAPHTDVINQPALMNHDYILLWVRPDGHVSMNATFGATMTQYLEAVGDTLSAQLTENTPNRVAGRIFAPKPVTVSGGETYTIDITFAATVARAPTGTPLPAGGGAPGAALKALDLAIAKKDWQGIKAGLTPARVASFERTYNTPQENLDGAVETLRAWLPKKGMKVTGGEVRGEVAIVVIEGEMFPGSAALYLASLARTGTVWQLDAATLVGMLP